MSRIAAAVLAILAAAPPPWAAAQSAPRRPRLGNQADTNDASAYFQWALERVERSPEQAYAAFYWASRLDPSSPQTLYAQGVALLLRDQRRVAPWHLRDQRVLDQPAVRAIDSLRFRAEQQDPFFHRGMEELVLRAFVRHGRERDEWLLGSESQSRTAATTETERFLESSDPYSRGLLYYGTGRLREALEYWAIAQRTQATDWVHAERARAWFELRQLDSARAAMEAAIQVSRTAPAPVRHVYEWRPAWLYALGRIHEDRRDFAAARAAYEDALRESVRYYPAMLRLGVLSVMARDTASALFWLSEATAGSQVAFFALTAVATVYSQLGRLDSAVVLMRRATASEPWASTGWLMQARALESVRDTAGAIQSYERYLALAPRQDASRPAVSGRVQALRPAGARP